MCAKFHAKIIIFPGIIEGEGAIMAPYPWEAPKKPTLNRVKDKVFIRRPLNICHTV